MMAVTSTRIVMQSFLKICACFPGSRKHAARLLVILGICLTCARGWAAAPVVPTKSRTISELGGAAVSSSAPGSTNNLLAGVTDPDGGTSFTLTSFSVGGVTTNVPGSYPIPNPDPQFAETNIGTITVNANGSYSFAAAAITANYQYNSNYGPVPLITFSVADAQNETANGTLQLTVTPFNNGPANTIPSYNTPEDTPLTMNTVGSNGVPALSLDDDAKEINGTVTVSIMVSKDDLTFTGSMGTMLASPGHGLTVLVRNDNDGLADGKADTVSVTLTGLIEDVNAYLADPTGPITWTPPSDYNSTCISAYRVSMVSSDMGNASAGAPGQPRRDITRRLLNIIAVRDRTNDNLVTAFNTPKAFNVLSGAGDATADSFESPNAAVTALNGAAFTSGQTIVLPSGNSVAVSADGSMTFTPAAGFTGQDSFQYSAGFCQETATVTIDVGPMPVKLIDFSAAASDAGNILSWSTTEEVNSEYFEVQRSFDGRGWTVMGKTAALGTSSSLHSYTFHDPDRADQTVYYRLKMVDLDGSFTYSSLRSIIAVTGETYVWPNPASSYFNFSGLADGTINLFNAAGGKAWQKQVINHRVTTEGLPPGTYLIRGQGSVKSWKVVIRH